MIKKDIQKYNNNNYITTKTILIFWIIVMIIGGIIGGINVAIGLLLAAILSIIIFKFTLNSSWEGTIKDIKTQKIANSDPEEEGYDYKEITYAYLKLTSGKKKKIRAFPDWKIGDKIKKEKG
ncbi:MAG: hypothetical protein ACOCP8_07940, partial [archaeon]